MPIDKKHKVDLTDKNALVAAFKKHSNDLWQSFGTGPLYKDYDVNKVIDFINGIIDKEKVHISPEKKQEIFDVLKQKGKNVKMALQYIANVFLKGAGLGLNDGVIKEEEPNYYKKIQNKLKSIDSKKQRLNKLTSNPPHIKGPGDKNNQFVQQMHKKMIDADKQDIDVLKMKKKQADAKRLGKEGVEDKLRAVIRETIREILNEKDLGLKYSEKQWNSEDSTEEKDHFFKKFSNSSFKFKSFKPEKFKGLSFNELPGDVQKAWNYYIHKMK